jgi:hypothetical protein
MGEREGRGEERKMRRCCVAGFEDGGRGSPSEGCSQFLEAARN